MPNFDPTGDLVTDINLCIQNSNVMNITYTDSKGNYSERAIAPLEVRGDRFYAADLGKHGLRLFILKNVDDYQVLDDIFDKDSLVIN